MGYWVILHFFCRLLIFFLKKSTLSKKSFNNAIRISNSFDPDKARHFVGPDLDQNCLQRLSADDTSRQRIKAHWKLGKDLLYISIFRMSFPRNVTQNMFVLIKIYCKCVFLQVNVFMPCVNILNSCRHKQSSTAGSPPWIGQQPKPQGGGEELKCIPLVPNLRLRWCSC